MAIIRDLLTSPQTVTNSWVDIGVEIGTDGYNDIAFWIKLTINEFLLSLSLQHQ